MCGRFSVTAEDAATLAEGLAEELGLRVDERVRAALERLHRPRWNAAPGDGHWLWLRADAGGPRAASWGLSRPGDDAKARRQINVRAESLLDARVPRLAEARRGALIVDGFFEWGGAPRGPWHFSRPASSRPRPLFALASLTWPSAAGSEFAVLTRAPTAGLARIHDRMPAWLPREALADWLDPRAPPARWRASLQTALPDDFVARRVSAHVNDPRHDDPRCLEAEAQRGLFDA